MENVLFDTNILLDIALKREPHFKEAFLLFKLLNDEKINGSVTATTITDIYYIIKKGKGYEIAIGFVSNLIETVVIIGIDKSIIKKAIEADMKDFEDAIQISAAQSFNVDCIITRNKKDFKDIRMEVFTPSEFLERQKL